MENLQTDSQHPGWVKGWMVLRVKQELPGDLVSVHAHVADAQAEAQQRGPGHQVFHGRLRQGTQEFVVD